MNFVHLLQDNIKKYGEHVFLSYEGQEYTNIETERLSNCLARGLMEKGLQKDDRVVIFFPNRPEVCISQLAILRAGGIVVPVNPSLSPQELSYILGHSEARMIITSAELIENVRSAKELSSASPLIIMVGEDRQEDSVSFDDCYAADDAFLMIDQPDDATAVIMYTSGTTGTSKGVMLSHYNVYMQGHIDMQACGIIDENGNRLRENTNTICVLPLSHVYGFSVMAVVLLAGSTMFIVSHFDVEQIFQTIQDNKIAGFPAVPTMYAWFAVYPGLEKYDVSSVDQWLAGSSALSGEIREAFEKRFNTKIYDAYGLTETVTGVSMQRFDRPTKVGSVGPAVPFVSLSIFDDDWQPLPIGEVGEIAVKGPNVMKGYYKNEEETARVLKDGWLRTGDMGYLDEDGDLFIVDRKKDLIIRGGFNIYPSEVERVLYGHPDISDAGVIGVPDKDYGEQVCAIVVLKEGATAGKKEVQSFCRERLAKYKIPRFIEFSDSLPKNDLGKTLRRQLRVNVNELIPVGEDS
ncbi:MAG: long-chain fatty acid--CoA ligase [Syntrophomonadaceae bacterium]|nr:long-chain fatty acid--CoA ligase [Syntrophomonadaceae bacterium]